MRRPIFQMLLVGLLITLPAIAATPQESGPRNVVLIVCDGLRWQEVFTGADATLMNGEAGGSWTPVSELREKYGADAPEARRARLLRLRGPRLPGRARRLPAPMRRCPSPYRL